MKVKPKLAFRLAGIGYNAPRLDPSRVYDAVPAENQPDYEAKGLVFVEPEPGATSILLDKEDYVRMVPDICDLNDWIMEHEPELFATTKYLQPSSAYDIWLPVWEAAGSPVGDFESALWEEGS